MNFLRRFPIRCLPRSHCRYHFLPRRLHQSRRKRYLPRFHHRWRLRRPQRHLPHRHHHRQPPGPLHLNRSI